MTSIPKMFVSNNMQTIYMRTLDKMDPTTYRVLYPKSNLRAFPISS